MSGKKSTGNQNVRRRVANPSTTTDEIDSDLDGTLDSGDGTKRVSESQSGQKQSQQKPKTKLQKFLTRFYVTWAMIFGFCGVIYVGHFLVAIILIGLQAGAFKEISALGAKPRKALQLSGYEWLHWHLFITSVFFLYGQTLLEITLLSKNFIFSNSIVSSIVTILLRHHGFISFSMVCLGLISFVLSLKRTFYKYQFKQLAWCLVIIVIVVGQSAFAINNLFDGLVWLVIPALCIITNDVMAYMCGMMFGKTPLIKLSPNKTWEGAIGGGIFTILIAFIFSPLVINFEMMVCPKRDWTFEWPKCDKDPTFIQTNYSFPDSIQSMGKNIGISQYWMNDWMIAPFQFHALMFAAFASIVGPFGGFFASGFKRAFGIKDFAQLIPGHGGITDRFDCHILMAAYVFVYRKSFVRPISVSAATLLPVILRLPLDEQKLLLQGLQTALVGDSTQLNS